MFEEIDHGKFFVIVGVSDDYVAGFFFINSDIHRSLFGKKEQLALQYPLRHKDYGFLKHDSFLCATNIIKRPRKYIAESVKEKKTVFVDSLKKEHLDEILDMVRQSRLFSKVDKDRFFY